MAKQGGGVGRFVFLWLVGLAFPRPDGGNLFGELLCCTVGGQGSQQGGGSQAFGGCRGV